MFKQSVHRVQVLTGPASPEGLIKVRLCPPPPAQSVRSQNCYFFTTSSPRLEPGIMISTEIPSIWRFLSSPAMICTDSNGFFNLTSSGYSQPFVDESEGDD